MEPMVPIVVLKKGKGGAGINLYLYVYVYAHTQAVGSLYFDLACGATSQRKTRENVKIITGTVR